MVHELSHAFLDSIRPYLTAPVNAEVGLPPIRRRRIGCDPRTLPLVVVVVGGCGQRQVAREVGVEGDPAQPIATQSAGAVVGIAHGAEAGPRERPLDGGAGLVLGDLGYAQHERMVVGDVVGVQAASEPR